MKWYWILAIVVGVIILAFYLYLQHQPKRPDNIPAPPPPSQQSQQTAQTVATIVNVILKAINKSTPSDPKLTVTKNPNRWDEFRVQFSNIDYNYVIGEGDYDNKTSDGIYRVVISTISDKQHINVQILKNGSYFSSELF